MEPRTPLRNLVTEQGLLPGMCAIKVLLHVVTIDAPYKSSAGRLGVRLTGTRTAGAVLAPDCGRKTELGTGRRSTPSFTLHSYRFGVELPWASKHKRPDRHTVLRVLCEHDEDNVRRDVEDARW